jgi:type IV pilus assembly protein PilB
VNAVTSESGRLRSTEEGVRYVLAGPLKALVQETDPELGEHLQQTLVRLRELIPAALITFLEIRGHLGEARLVSYSADPGVAELLPREPFPAGRLGFLASQAWLHSPYRIEVVHRDLPQPSIFKNTLGARLNSVVAVPTLLGPDLTGVLAALRLEGSFSARDLALLERVLPPLKSLYRRTAGLEGTPNEDERLGYLSELTGCDRLDAEGLRGCPALLRDIGGPVLLRYRILPLEDLGEGHIRAAISDPLDWRSLDDFEGVSGYRITERCLAPAGQIRDRLEVELEELSLHDTSEDGPRDLISELAEGLRGADAELDSAMGEPEEEDLTPVVRLASELIREAYALGASDIHIEARELSLVVRFRVDGVCRERLQLPARVARSLVARLKVMSDLNIAEHRLPQDGRLHFARFEPDVDIDLRVSVMPMLHGECVVLRLLDRQRSGLDLTQLGFSDHNLSVYRQRVRSPFGMILHCGPTGSGKSTTLYAALKEINDPQWKIVAAEDPIEFTLDGINQLQIRPQIGLTFAAALRSFLRHDPDVILVGEIRDSETARIAVEASLTGHLLLSTLHTNDATTSVARLQRLGIEPLLLGSTLISVCAQRLVRRVCSCAGSREPDPQSLSLLRRARDGKPPGRVPVPTGCERCHHSGYRGRIGVHELLAVGSRIRQLISDGVSAEVLKQAARKQGMRTMFEDSMAKVNSGATSLEEALRVSRPDELN